MTELHLDTVCIAGSKQHIGNPNSGGRGGRGVSKNVSHHGWSWMKN